MTKSAFSVSVIVEWYNTTHAELERARQMLSALQSQAAALLTPSDGPGAVRLSQPLELIVVFNSRHMDQSVTHKAVHESMKPSPALEVRLLAAPDATYCQQKNLGAAAAAGEILLFLDSDVIPEPDWLAAFLRAFTDPGVSVVCGNTYVDHSGNGTYNKAMALTWMFPLREPEPGIGPLKMFYANNLAFRRHVFLARQFPDVPGFIHAPAPRLVDRLESEGIPIWSLDHARASHPAPNGAAHFIERALSGGKARALSSGRPKISMIAQWFVDDFKTIAFSCKKIVVEGFKVGLRRWQVPAAMAIGTLYHALYFSGSAVSAVAPRLVRSYFKL